MAIQLVNVYSFTVYLKTKQDKNYHVGTSVMAIGATPAAAQQVLQQQFGSDLKVITGGVMVFGPAYTTLA